MTFDQYADGTRCVHAGRTAAVPGQPFLAGPVFASTYPLDPHTGPVSGVDSYGRPDNLTRRRLEAAIGELEGGDCLAFASGMAAVSALLFTLLGPGSRLVLPSDGYYRTRAFATEQLGSRGVRIDLVRTAGPYPDLTGTTLVVLETPANPGLDVCDIAALATAAHGAGALLAVDNTTATPLGQRPLDLGADIVVASATKALSGHADLLLGYLATRDPGTLARFQGWRDSTGAIPSPFDAWLAHRSLSTLDLRLARQAENAQALAQALGRHPAVRTVRWPGLAGDPAHQVATVQMRRMPGVVTFELADADAVLAFLLASHLVTAATSFGGLHTTADRRAQWGDDTPPGLVRLSCGIEDPVDLVPDLLAALDQASTAGVHGTGETASRQPTGA
jgi:cystathionine gamma-lyase